MNRQWTDEQVEDFWDYLKGGHHTRIQGFSSSQPLTPKQAFSVIYYLQEELEIIPQKWELCQDCEHIYDSHHEGVWIDDDDTEYVLPKGTQGGFCDNCFAHIWNGEMK